MAVAPVGDDGMSAAGARAEGRFGHALGGAELGDRLTGPAGGGRITTRLRHRQGDILHGVRDAADDTSPVNHMIRRARTLE